jgi:NADPH:quinone reductase
VNRAWTSVAPGPPESLQLIETPIAPPAKDQVLIAVKACGINYFDYLIVQDRYQLKPPRPFSPGAEWAGVVEAIGEAVTAFAPGDRVLAAASYGGLAEKTLSPASACRRVPAQMSFTEGAGYQTAFGTAYYALRERGAMRAGDALLVLGGAGGQGAAAIQIGKALGARVLAIASTPEKAAFARAQGADEVALLAPELSGADLREAVKTLCGAHGADVVFDPVGGEHAQAALRAIAWNGRYLVVGFTAGIPSVALNLALLKHASILGCRWGGFSRANPAAAALLRDEIDALYRSGALRSIVTQVFPFEQAPDAIATLGARRGMGKLVVEVGA